MDQPARKTRQPCPDAWMLLGGVVVENEVDDLTYRDLSLSRVEKADELLIAMALHVLADDRAVEHVTGVEQRCLAVSYVVVCHCSGAAFLDRQPRLAAVEGLYLAFLVETEHDCVRRRVDVEPDDIAQLGDELRVV